MGGLEIEYKDFLNSSDYTESEYGFFSERRIEKFISLLEKDIIGDNLGIIDIPYSFDILKNMVKTKREIALLDRIIPLITEKLKKRRILTLESKEQRAQLVRAIDSLPRTYNIHTTEYGSETEKNIRYYYKEGKEVSDKGVSSNKKLTEILLFLDTKKGDNSKKSKDIVIDFGKIAEKKDAESINTALEKIFSYYNYSRKFLYLITGFIALLQSQGYGIHNKELFKGISLFLKKNFPEYLLEPSILENKNKELLKDPNYWSVRNLLQLYDFSSKIQDKTGKQELIIGTFSPGGSYGPIYLGQLYSQYTQEKKSGVKTLPDIYIGSSAGSLYPTLFLLWKMALEKNPVGLSKIIQGNVVVDSIDSLISLIPNGLKDSDSMLFNGSKLINSFFEVFKKLVEVISPGKKIDFDKLSFEDLGIPIIAVGSYEYENGKYIPGLFTQKDNIKKSILVSSNPKTKILGLDFNILSSDNEIYGLKWNDGFYSIGNPIEIGYLLNYSTIHRYESYNTYEDDIVKFEGYENKIINHNPLDGVFNETKTQGNGFDKDSACFYSIIGQGNLEIHDLYRLINEINNSKISLTKKKYYRDKLVGFFLTKSDIISSLENIEKNIDEIKKLFLGKILSEDEKKIVLQKIFPDLDKKKTLISSILKQIGALNLRVAKLKKMDNIEESKITSRLINDISLLIQDDISYYYSEINKKYLILQGLKGNPIVKAYIDNVTEILNNLLSKILKKDIEGLNINSENVEKLKKALSMLEKICSNK